MWSYRQSDGELRDGAGAHAATGYSGAGHTAATGRNNPDMQGVSNKGPIPRGRYRIGAPHTSDHTGPYTMNLDAEPGTDTLGRSAFRIHGNDAQDDASHGCIIMARFVRTRIWESGDHEIEVVR